MSPPERALRRIAERAEQGVAQGVEHEGDCDRRSCERSGHAENLGVVEEDKGLEGEVNDRIAERPESVAELV